MKILVTGAAGFIGFHLVNRLISDHHSVIGLDNINNYYDVKLKYARLKETGIAKEYISYNSSVKSSKFDNYKFVKLDLEDTENINNLFEEERFDIVCNLAAQAGVRYSLDAPRVYIKSNVMGFLNILEACRNYKVKNLLYASSSSVYGLNLKQPFSEKDKTDTPASFYAATKKSNELMAHVYSHLFNINTTGLRFFTVYGPWGRPDMAIFRFLEAMSEGNRIDLYNDGNMERDFTYIDDVINGVVQIIYNPNKGYHLYNIGRGKPIRLRYFVGLLEQYTGIRVEYNMLPIQPGDVKSTYADTQSLYKDYGYKPRISIENGVYKTVKWYMKFINKSDM